MELVRTRELLERYLPRPPARVLDVGGGTGVHAVWLASRGYDVHLVDPMAAHVIQARAHGGFTATEGDARRLSEAEASADAVLLLGPLYHLVQRPERLHALSEAKRVLRPGGVMATAAIGRYMVLLTHCADGDLDPERMRDLSSTLATGRYDGGEGFTEAYLHRPDELSGELGEAGFEGVEVFGLEGPAWPAVDAAGLESERHLEAALVCARAVEQDPALLSLSAHLLAVGRAPQ